MTSRRWSAGLVLAAVVSLVLTSCSGGSAPASSGSDGEGASLQTVKIQTYPANQASWPAVVALQKGFFEDNGIKAVLKNVDSGAVAASALASDSVDIATINSSIAAPLLDGGQELNAISGDNLMSWHLITTQASAPSDQSYPAGVKALAGKKIAVTSIGSGSYFMLLAILQGAGLSKDDVTIVPTGSLPAFDTAFRTGKVDAGLADHGTYVRLDLNGAKPVNLVDMTEPAPGFSDLLSAVAGAPDTSYWSKAAWVDENPDMVEAFQKSIAQAVVWLKDPSNRAEVDKLLTDYGTPEGLDPKDYIEGVLPIMGAAFPADAMTAQQKFVVQNEIGKKAYPASDLLAPGTPATADEVAALAAK